MPSYDFHCKKCDETFEVSRPMSKASEPQSCGSCGLATDRIFSVPGMVFAGDGWASKNGRIESQMAAKGERLSKAQNDRKQDDRGRMELAPNVEGQRTDTWSEAKSMAKSLGKDTASYDTMIRKEASA